MNSKRMVRGNVNPLLLAAAMAALGVVQSRASATTYTYTNSTSDSTEWSNGTAAHWDVKPVSSSSTALVFAGAPGSGVVMTSDNDIGSPTPTNFVLNSMSLTMPGIFTGASPTFNLTGYTLEFAGPAPIINIGGGGTSRPIQWNISTPIQVDADLTINASAGSNGIDLGIISGNFGLVKTGAGSFLVSAAATYSGATTISGGTLNVKASVGGTINQSSGYVVDAGTLVLTKTTEGFQSTDMLNDSASVTLSRGATFNLVSDRSNASESIGSLVVSGGNSVYTASTGATGGPNLTAAAFSRINNGTALLAIKLGGVGIGSARVIVTDTSGLSFVGADTANTGAATIDTSLRIIPYLFAGNASTSIGDNFVTYDTNASGGGIRTLQAGEQVTLTDGYATPAVHENAIAATTATLATPTVNSLLFTGSAGLAGSGTLTVDSGAIGVVGSSSNGSISGFSGLTLKNGEGIVVVTAGSLSIASNLDVTGSSGELALNGGGLTKAGAGTLILNGASSYSGVTNINQGTIVFAKSASLYNGNSASWTASNLSVKPGSGIAFNVGGVGEFTESNISTLLSNLSASTGMNNGMSAGTSITLDTSNAVGGTFTVAGNLTDSTGAFGGQRSLIKLGANTLVLSGTNTYTGTTTISAGTVEFVNQASLYNNTTASWSKANITVASGATLALRVGGAGEFTVSNINTLQSLKSGNSAGGLVAGSTLGLDTTDGNFTYSSAITDRTSNLPGTINFIKLGANTLSTTVANTYTGMTTVAGGTLSIDAGTGHTSAALSTTSSVTVAATSTANTVLSLSSNAVGGTIVNLINDNAGLILVNNGLFVGQINLNFAAGSTVIEQVASLTINGVAEAPGFYTASSTPTYFTGAGTLQVLPEPASLGLFMLLGMGMTRRRVRRR